MLDTNFCIRLLRDRNSPWGARFNLAFDAEAAAHTNNIRAGLERKWPAIAGYDVLIAGHARSKGLVVVTGHLREFESVEGLRAEDWLGS